MKNKKSIVLSKFLNISEPSYFRWKAGKHSKLIYLLEKYFSESDILEFEDTNSIKKFDLKEELSHNFFEINIINYFSIFTTVNSLKGQEPIFISFYFNFLLELKKGTRGQSTTDSFVFTKNFYDLDINILYNSLLFSYIQDGKITIHQNYILSKGYIKYLSNFDRWLLFLLNFLFLDDLKTLYDHNFYNPSMDERKEAFYHVLGFYIFSSDAYNDLSDDKKINKIDEIYKQYLELPTQQKYQKFDKVLKVLSL